MLERTLTQLILPGSQFFARKVCLNRSGQGQLPLEPVMPGSDALGTVLPPVDVRSSIKSKRAMSTVNAVAQSVAAKMLIIAINAVTGIITARALKPEGRGELAALVL